MKLFTTAILLSSILLLFSCNNEDELSGDDIPGYSPLLLSVEAPSPFTRAYIPQGMCDNFKVYAASEKDGVRTSVMNGYEVKFINDDWTYVSETQPLMYWNSNADRYLFTAGAPISAVTAISVTSMTLHLENNLTESAMASSPQKIEQSSEDFGKTVNLRFAYAHCRVCVAFKMNAENDIAVTDIKLTPKDPIASKADITYTYDWSPLIPTASSQVNTTETSKAELSFADVTIPANKEDAILSETRHYCVPDASNSNEWTISLKCDGEEKTGQFQNSYTWESGKNYIYLFSLTDNGPKLVKVISQDMYFDCNDIIPGGEFSGSDMTE